MFQMSRRKLRGASVLAVLGLVTVLSFLAAAMAALFLHGLHFSQSSFNGDIALSQAEAALNEAMYRLGSDEQCTFGKNGEEFSGTIQPDLSLDESYYRVTFRRDASLPFSTNNVERDAPLSGYEGRPVGKGCVHVLANGFCRGQWRIIEALVRKPEAPYGIASSGPIHSRTPLVVYGTDSAEAVGDERYERPGHIVSNSTEGVSIERPPGTPAADVTHVSGFIQSVGEIHVDQPARVDAGLRPNSSAVELPDFRIAEEFDPAGQPGTVEIVELNHPAQELDVIYRSGHDLTFSGPVKLHDAYLYVRGHLVINGGVSGRGAIVVDGDVDISGDVSLDGSNSVALLSTGEINLRGSGNYFQGFVYAERGIHAENLTVVGSLILNHGSVGGAEPRLELDRVKVINDDSQGELTFTARSYSYTTSQAANSGSNFLTFDWTQWGQIYGDQSGGAGGIPEAELPDKLIFVLGYPGAEPDKMFTPPIDLSGLTALTVPYPGGPNISTVLSAQQQYAQARPDDIEALFNEMQQLESQNPPDPSPERTRLNQLHSQVDDALQKFQAFHTAVQAFANEYTDFVKGHSNPNGSRRLRDGAAPTDVEHVYVLDLNKYLPASDRLHVSYWHLHQHRF